MWSLDLQHEQHLGTCWKHGFQPFTPALLSKRLRGWDPAICDLLSPPDDSDDALMWEALYQGIKEGFPKEVSSIWGISDLSVREERKWCRSACSSRKPGRHLWLFDLHIKLFSMCQDAALLIKWQLMSMVMAKTNSLLVMGREHFGEMSTEDEFGEIH